MIINLPDDAVNHGPENTLIDFLRLRARSSGGQASLHFASDPDPCLASGVWETSLGFGELDRAARAVAVRLWEHGGEPGDRVLLLYPPGLDFAIGFWGALYAGMIAVPLPMPRVHHAERTSARLRSVVRNSGARIALTSSAASGRLARGLAEAGGFEGLTLLAGDTVDLATADKWEQPPVTSGTVAYLQYSSGSTGTPKGAVLRHANVLANCFLIGDAVHIGSHRSVCSWLPTFHDMGLVSAMIMPVVFGLDLYQMPPLAFVQRPLDWLRTMSAVRAELGVAPTFAYELCARRIGPERARELDLSNWKVAFCGAEPIRPEVLRAFAERFAVAGFSPRALFPCYGMAEATLMISGGPYLTGMRTARVDPAELGLGRIVPPADGGPAQEIVAAGGLCPGIQVLAVAPATATPCPPGTVGELMLKGDSIASGYWNSPETTSESFGLTIEGHGDGFLRTGDLGFVHDGQVHVTGRIKDLIIVDGANHYPQDLEAAAASVHPALRAGACAAFQLIERESPGVVVVAEVDRSFRFVPGSAVTVSDIRDSIRRAVSADHSLPLDDILLVKQGALPMTTSGKIQRFAAAEQYRADRFAEFLVESPDTPDNGRCSSPRS
jgi:acyl-CoA synthetase (AMP-forming)/AMP-acid ligase II